MLRFRMADLFLVTMLAALVASNEAPRIKQWLQPPSEMPGPGPADSPFITHVPQAKWSAYLDVINQYRTLRSQLRERRAARLVPVTAKQATAEEEALAKLFGESLSDSDLRRAFMSAEEVRARQIERRHAIRKEMRAKEQQQVPAAPR